MYHTRMHSPNPFNLESLKCLMPRNIIIGDISYSNYVSIALSFFSRMRVLKTSKARSINLKISLWAMQEMGNNNHYNDNCRKRVG